ncbi:unnamed protein product, partial [Cyprideis torosa]
MEADCLDGLTKMIPALYLDQGANHRKSVHSIFHHFLHQRKLPNEPWSDTFLELFFNEMSLLDSNNFVDNVGAGEREGRTFSDIVRRRNFRLIHGIGRSGDLQEIQPKAAGSSAISCLANLLALDAFKIAGIHKLAKVLIVPVATGMALTMTMLTLRHRRPESAKYVLFSRVDQKSCFKSIHTAGFTPHVVELVRQGDELSTDLSAFETAIRNLGADSILCVLSATSCFAPRSPDNIPALAKLCKDRGIPHVVNNAYGIQSTKCCNLISEGARVGRVDVFIQSTDKNFLVPVGGSVVAGFDPDLVIDIGKTYPGRASLNPSLDVLTTLLSLGANGWRRELTTRQKVIFPALKKGLEKIAEKHGERILVTPKNVISIGLTLSTIPHGLETRLGSMLFTRHVSGARVVSGREEKTVAGVKFQGWGAHCDTYPVAYLTAAAGLGMTLEEVEIFLKRLDKCLTQLKEKKVTKTDDCDGRTSGSFPNTNIHSVEGSNPVRMHAYDNEWYKPTEGGDTVLTGSHASPDSGSSDSLDENAIIEAVDWADVGSLPSTAYVWSEEMSESRLAES